MYKNYTANSDSVKQLGRTYYSEDGILGVFQVQAEFKFNEKCN